MRSARRRQRGNILLPVTLIGLIVTLTLSALMNHALVLEQVAVENRLAEIRSYWAVMGHFRYALSRTRHSWACPSNHNVITILGVSVDLGCPDNSIKDTERVPVVQGYLNEISAYRTFTYPEEAAAYSIKIDLTTAVDDSTSRHTYSGHLMITSSYPTTGASTLGILSGAPNRFMPLQLRFCAGLNNSGSSCGTIGNNNGGNATGYYSVKRLYRRNSVS
jgi:hypothetical protein